MLAIVSTQYFVQYFGQYCTVLYFVHCFVQCFVQCFLQYFGQNFVQYFLQPLDILVLAGRAGRRVQLRAEQQAILRTESTKTRAERLVPHTIRSRPRFSDFLRSCNRWMVIAAQMVVSGPNDGDGGRPK